MKGVQSVGSRTVAITPSAPDTSATPAKRMTGPHCGVAVTPAAAEGVVNRLMAAGCVAAEEEADELLAGASDQATLDTWLRRREQGEPLAWITGVLRFCGQTLHVVPGLYVPRIQSEELACRAAGLLPDNGRAVDFCTGVGAVAAHLTTRVPTAKIIGIDIDVRAAVCARRNSVQALVADLDQPLRCNRVFDVVTAVAPYVPTSELRLLPADVQRYEPRVALDGGEDGLELVRRIVAAAGRLLHPGGWLLIELGGTQDQALASALAASGFDRSEPWWDEAGDLRGLAAHVTASEPGL